MLFMILGASAVLLIHNKDVMYYKQGAVTKKAHQVYL
jgi:hypothetical protein